MANEPGAEPAKKKGKGLLILILLGVFAIGGGASVPWLIGGQSSHGKAAQKKADPKKASKLDAIPFSDIAVNVSGDQKRYMRMKLLVAVEVTDVREITDLLNKQKPFLKNWLIGYMQEQHYTDLIGKSAINRIRREVRDRFNLMLYPDGDEKIVDILIDEYMVQ